MQIKIDSQLFTCSICSEKYNLETRKPYIICNNHHTICSYCLGQLDIDATCPYCRQPIVDKHITINLYVYDLIPSVYSAKQQNKVQQKIKEEQRSLREKENRLFCNLTMMSGILTLILVAFLVFELLLGTVHDIVMLVFFGLNAFFEFILIFLWDILTRLTKKKSENEKVDYRKERNKIIIFTMLFIQLILLGILLIIKWDICSIYTRVFIILLIFFFEGRIFMIQNEKMFEGISDSYSNIKKIQIGYEQLSSNQQSQPANREQKELIEREHPKKEESEEEPVSYLISS